MANIARFLVEKLTGVDPEADFKRQIKIDEIAHSPGIDEHILDPADLFVKFGTDEAQGLDGSVFHHNSAVKKSMHLYGTNSLTSTIRDSELKKLLVHQMTGFAGPIWISGLCNLISYLLQGNREHLYVCAIVLGIAVLTGIFVYTEGGRAVDIVDFFNTVEEKEYHVLRNGGKVESHLAKDLVVGDILVGLGPGSKIPADVYILDCSAQSIVLDCPENFIVRMRKGDLMEPRTNKATSADPLKTRNLAFRGSDVVTGEIVKSVVIKVGDETQVGRALQVMAANSARKDQHDSAVQKELSEARKRFNQIGIVIGLLGLMAASLAGVSIFNALIIASGFLLAAIPLGLNICLTVCMQVALVRLKRLNLMVKGQGQVESLGSTSCMIVDHRHFLVKDNQDVAGVYYLDDENQFQSKVTGSAFSEYHDEYDEIKNEPVVQELHKCAILCMDPTVKFDEASKYTQRKHRGKSFKKERKFSIGAYYETSTGESIVRREIQWKTLGNSFDAALLKFFYPQEDVLFRTQQIRSAAKEDSTLDSFRKHQEDFALLFRRGFTKATGYEVQIRCAYRGDLETNNQARVVFLKGKPEEVISRCDKVRTNSGVTTMSLELREMIQQKVIDLGYFGLKIVAFAESENLKYKDYNQKYPFSMSEGDDASANFPLGVDLDYEGRPDPGKDYKYRGNERNRVGLVFLGFIATYETPHAHTHDAIQRCHQARIRMFMTTGMDATAATAQARDMGIIGAEDETDLEIALNNKYLRGLMAAHPELGDSLNARIDHVADEFGVNPIQIRERKLAEIRNPSDAKVTVVTTSDLDKNTLSRNAWWDAKLLQFQHAIFCRCQKEQKELIVKHAQRLGQVVTCTGDLGSDVGALKVSDVGIVMQTSTDAAKDAADILISHESGFAPVVDGIAEGRRVFENLKKTVAYMMVSNVPQLLGFLSFALVRIPLPFSTPLILVVDIITNLIPGIGLAFEPLEDDIMSRPPRNVFLDKLLTGKMLWFSYLQLGMMQAFAAFYAYIVVMNDFGYPPHLLVLKGDNDYWGNYPLYCKFEGGQYVNGDGQIDPSRNPMRHPPRFEFPLWDEGDDGYVKECVFPVKNFLSNTETEPRSEWTNKDFRIGTAASYTTDTYGRAVTTVEVIDALEDAGFYEYTPWKGRMSEFWMNKWMAYDIRGEAEARADNQIPTKTEEQEKDKLDVKLTPYESGSYFNKMPLGLFSVCLSNPRMEDGRNYPPHVNDAQMEAIDAWNASESSTTGCLFKGEYPLQQARQERVSLFQDATFCNGDGSYNRILETRTLEENYDTFPRQEREQLAELAAKCRHLDDHPHQIKYCVKECSPDCELVSAEDRANSTLWNRHSPQKGAGENNVDSWHQCANISSRMVQKEALHNARTAFFVAIVICQLAAAMCIKTRWASVLTHGLGNSIINFGVWFSLIAAAFTVYTGWGRTYLGTRPLRFIHWMPAIPWAVSLFVFDEMRKFLMRVTSMPVKGIQHPEGGWLERHSRY